jgi:hypothetical protein
VNKMPRNRQPWQLYAVWQFESPVHTYNWNSLGPNYFNMTITYREDGDVFYPHGFFMPRPDKVDPADEDLIWTEQEVSESIFCK